MDPAIVVPRPRFPEFLDGYRELFKVYDSASGRLLENLEKGGRRLTIRPRPNREGLDVWGPNGFINIGGEVIYYDSVIYESVPTIRSIFPETDETGAQVYYLSKARLEISTGEILRDLSLGKENPLINRDVVLDNLIDSIGYTWSGVCDLEPPYSLVGRCRIKNIWYSFVLKGAGGLLGTSLLVSPTGSGISSMTLSETGVLVFAQVVPDLMEIDYHYSPRELESVVPSTLDVYHDGQLVVDSGQAVSTEISNFDLDPLGGILRIFWRTLHQRKIEVLFKSGRVVTLENCTRGYFTDPTFHRKGDRVSGFVMATHHNNLIIAVQGIQRYLLELDARLEQLETVQVECNPECPRGELSFEIVDEGPKQCVFDEETIRVHFTVTSENATGNRLFFGDGEFEDDVTSTFHNYLPGTSFSPTIFFRNALCEEYSCPGESASVPDILFDLILPEIPAIELPDFEIPDLTIGAPEVDVDTPVIVGPTIGPPIIDPVDPIEPPDWTIPTQITIIGPTEIVIIGAPTVIPPTIRVIDNLPRIITIAHTIPTSIIMNVSIPTSIIMNVSIPTEITLTGLSIPTEISLTGISIPTSIEITGLSIPTKIEIDFAPGVRIPTQIGFNTEEFPTEIKISVAVSTENISGNCFKLVPCSV